MTIDKAFLHKQLQCIGINPGDVLWVRIDLGAMGRIKGFKRQDYVRSILDYLGPTGTLVTLADSDYKFTLGSTNLPQFDPSGKANTGAFPNIMLSMPESLRSVHPTNSIVAIGSQAHSLIYGHDENAGSYDYFKKIVDLQGKILIVGCPNHPGFLTHGVQGELGHYRRRWYRYFLKTRLASGEVFVKMDPGGCSSNSYALYPYYIKAEALRLGRVGAGYAACIDAIDAYRIDKKLLASNPNMVRCDDPLCLDCRAGTWGTIWKLPLYIGRRFLKKASRLFGTRQRSDH